MGMPLDLIWLTVPAYLIVQTIAIAKAPASARLSAAIPLFAMIPVFGYSLFSLMNGGNLWPLPILFACPIALIYVTVKALSSASESNTSTRDDFMSCSVNAKDLGGSL